jgi:predicted 3-demethylubiquinone-9 3-methyltransferase (glyoxalase superfamily)
MIPKNTICLWYDRDAEAAARLRSDLPRQRGPRRAAGTG